MTIIGNFDVTSTTIDPAFQRTGKWYNYLSGDSITVTNANALITLAPGAYAVYTSRRILKKATLLGTKASATDALRLTAVPNPTSSTASLHYELATPAPVTVTVLNVLGATVRTIAARNHAGRRPPRARTARAGPRQWPVPGAPPGWPCHSDYADGGAALGF